MKTIKIVTAVISLILLAVLVGYLVFTGSRVSAKGQILPLENQVLEAVYEKTDYL